LTLTCFPVHLSRKFKIQTLMDVGNEPMKRSGSIIKKGGN